MNFLNMIMMFQMQPFETATIKQIKEWAKQNNFKIPSGLNKNELILYIKGLQQERLNGVQI